MSTFQKIKSFLLENKTARQTVAKNTFWLFFGEIGGRILKLAVVVFATRMLGVENWGMFSYALAFVSLFYVFGDIGINIFITREMSKGGTDKYRYLSATFALKIILLTLSFFTSIILVSHFKTITLDLKIITILALLNFSDSVREFAFSINRALEKMEREALIKILMNIIIAVLGIILLMRKADPLSLTIAYTTGSIIASIIAILTISSEIKHINWKFSPRTIKTILNFSWPFIAITLFSTVIFNIDSIMLGQMKSVADVGFYVAALRVFQFLAIIPIFIAVSLFPIMSKSEADTETSGRIFEKSMILMLAIGFPVAISGILFGQEIIALIFGTAYIQAGVLFGILMVAIFADFPNTILSNVIFAKNLQRGFILIMAMGTIVNIILNIFLIPRYGAIGAAISTVIARLLIMAISWKKLKKIFTFSIIPRISKIILSTIAMTIIILLFNTIGIYFMITILIAMTGYVLMLYILREPTLIEILSIVKK